MLRREKIKLDSDLPLHAVLPVYTRKKAFLKKCRLLCVGLRKRKGEEEGLFGLVIAVTGLQVWASEVIPKHSQVDVGSGWGSVCHVKCAMGCYNKASSHFLEQVSGKKMLP